MAASVQLEIFEPITKRQEKSKKDHFPYDVSEGTVN